MSERTAALPSFRRPPVNEVVLSVAFDRPQRLSAAHIGNFWHTRLREELPEVEEQPPYNRPIEILADVPSPQALNFQLLDRPPSPRLWAKNNDGTRLVQLQPDWFAFNWRDTPAVEQEYVRWPTIESEFVRFFAQLRDYLATEDLGVLTARQCEVTYINQIRPVDGVWSDHGQIDHVTTLLGGAETFLPGPETSQLTTAYRIKDFDGVLRGRLHITVQPTFRIEDNEPTVILTLIARGAPAEDTEAAIVDFLRLGHEWIVQGFAAITTEEMQRAWERLT
ncbi:MAG: TIGR04255 family protein [Acidimicrobiales bacterium]